MPAQCNGSATRHHLSWSVMQPQPRLICLTAAMPWVFSSSSDNEFQRQLAMSRCINSCWQPGIKAHALCWIWSCMKRTLPSGPHQTDPFSTQSARDASTSHTRSSSSKHGSNFGTKTRVNLLWKDHKLTLVKRSCTGPQ